VAHPRARLNVLGRELLVTRVDVLGWPVATAAEAQGISRATGYKWVRRFRGEGSAGLVDRSSRPHRSPRATPAAEVERILAARTEWRWGPDRLGPITGHPASTVAAILRRSGVPRLADLDRPTGLPVRRYEACHPGALVHQDHIDQNGDECHGGGATTRHRVRAPPLGGPPRILPESHDTGAGSSSTHAAHSHQPHVVKGLRRPPDRAVRHPFQ
jgi:transposase-like protein